MGDLFILQTFTEFTELFSKYYYLGRQNTSKLQYTKQLELLTTYIVIQLKCVRRTITSIIFLRSIRSLSSLICTSLLNLLKKQYPLKYSIISVFRNSNENCKIINTNCYDFGIISSIIAIQNCYSACAGPHHFCAALMVTHKFRLCLHPQWNSVSSRYTFLDKAWLGVFCYLIIPNII